VSAAIGQRVRVADDLLTWRKRGGERVVGPEVRNAITILTHDEMWDGILAYDLRREAIVKLRPARWCHDDREDAPSTGEFGEEDATRLVAWLQREYRLDLSPTTVLAAARLVADRWRVDPVRDYLGGLSWDGEARLDTWLVRYAGAEDSSYVRAVGRRWMISAVARTFAAGCKVDCVLILEGEQGTGKSSLASILATQPQWFFDSDLQIGEKDAPQSLRGKWIVELGELAALSRHDSARIKGFVSRQVDTYRPTYGRRALDFPRRWVAVGTTNAREYLRDDTGGRRWWPVTTGRIDLAALRTDVSQLWAEAVKLYQQGAPWHVDGAEFARACDAEQEDRYVRDPWEGPIASWLCIRIRASYRENPGGSPAPVTTADVLRDAVTLDVGRWSRAEETRAGAILRRLGWVPSGRPTIDGARKRTYEPSADAVLAALGRDAREEDARNAAAAEWDARESFDREVGPLAEAPRDDQVDWLGDKR
jgi:putative DNA primase/helicase